MAHRRSAAPDGRPEHVVVLGAGVTGLYAGLVLARAGVLVTVIEAEPEVGGLAAGTRIEGNFYDLGAHHLHEFDRLVFEDVRELMAGRLLPVEKSAKIRYGRGYRRYPLEFKDLLLGVPPWTLMSALVGLAAQQVRNRLQTTQPRNAEEALVRLYGGPLYRHFFRDFTHRYWEIAPTGLSATFVKQKMPRLSAVDVARKALSVFGIREAADASVESALAHETMHYAPTGSREVPMALAEAICRRGGSVLTGSTVAAVETPDARLTAVRVVRAGREQRLTCDACLSTIPVPLLIAAMEPRPPAQVRDAATRLRYRPLAVYGLLVRRPRVLDAHYVYFRDRIFHRVAEPTNSGLEVTPPGHTVLLVELTCSLGDDRWEGGEATRRQIRADLAAEGLVQGEDIVEMHLLRAAHGYPIFELGFEPYHAAVMGFIESVANLVSTGRQGAFTYPNMHEAMRMGADGAREILGQAAESKAPEAHR